MQYGKRSNTVWEKSFWNNLELVIFQENLTVLSRPLSGSVAIFVSIFLHNDNTKMDFEFLDDIIYYTLIITVAFWASLIFLWYSRLLFNYALV